MTKLKTMMLSALAFAALISCTKQEAFDAQEGETSSMTFSFSVGDEKQTRAEQVPGVLGDILINSLTLEFWTTAQADGRLLKAVVLTSAQIAEVGGASKTVVLKNVPVDAGYVKAYANDKVPGRSKTIADFNKDVAFADVPLYGAGAVTDATPLATGRKASVTLAARAARFEIRGSIAPTTYAVHGVKDVKVEEVYINNYITTLGGTVAADLYCGKMSGTGDGWHLTEPEAPRFASDFTRNITLTDGGVTARKVDAYHFFPVSATAANAVDIASKCPHIVLKVSYKVQNAAGVEETIPNRWITLSTFNISGTLINEFGVGKIYQLDLAKLVGSFKQNPGDPGNPETPTDPDPEFPKATGSIEIEQAQWAEGGDMDVDL